MKLGKFILEKLTPFIWEIAPNAERTVPVRIYATESMLEKISRDKTITQLINVSHLPGIVSRVMAMPDAHEGYGFPIGGVAATRYPDGLISPGGIGYDINCGIRLLASGMKKEQISTKELKKLIQQIHKTIPFGVGEKSSLKYSTKDLKELLQNGVKSVLKSGKAFPEDLESIESNGTIPNADPGALSEKAISRGLEQVGTIGSGNHFIEINYVSKIFDLNRAQAMGLTQDEVCVLIHTGSRGLGHQTAEDYIKIMQKSLEKYNNNL